jgi:hypothetical protein
MSASRLLKWGAVATLLVASTAFVFAGGALGQFAPEHDWGHGGPTYNVTFSETGLAPGTHWSVQVYGHWGWHRGFERHGRMFSDNSTIVLQLPNGTFNYRVHSVEGYTVSGGGLGNVIVNGSATTVSIVFTPLPTYTVTFSETGLASGTNWTVALFGHGHGPWGPGGRHLVETSSSSSITFSLTNGTYHYVIFRVAGYSLPESQSFGRVVVNGSAASVNVAFTKLVLYTVTFSETGLPSGTNWTVGVGSWETGFEAGRSDTSSITFSLPNGTYFYFVGHVHNYTVNGTHFGRFNVSGAAVTIDVNFVPASDGWDSDALSSEAIAAVPH